MLTAGDESSVSLRAMNVPVAPTHGSIGL